MPCFQFETLREVAALLFRAAGSPPQEAETVARLLVAANLAGHDSHGVVRIPQYLRNLRRGLIVPGARLSVVSDHGAAVSTSANFGYGQTTSLEAMALATERAFSHNAAAVAVSEMNHNGRQADYCLQGAQQGVLTLIFAASSGFNRIVAPFGGSERRMNTNPFAVGIPNGETPMVFDIATSATSQGMLKVAADAGTEIPQGLILDAAGAPSTTPRDFYAGGAILPFGGKQGYKGYLLNFMVEVLGGILSNGGFMGHPIREAGGQCLLIIALNVAAFREMADFRAELASLTGHLKATRPMEGMEVLAPGERSGRKEEQRRADGIHLPPVTIADLQAELEYYGIGLQLLERAIQSR